MTILTVATPALSRMAPSSTHLATADVPSSSPVSSRSWIVELTTVGQGQVIQGWEQGLLDMCIGEKRILTIPSDMGYGKRGHPPVIPADATLTFDVELLDIKNRKEEL